MSKVAVAIHFQIETSNCLFMYFLPFLRFREDAIERPFIYLILLVSSKSNNTKNRIKQHYYSKLNRGHESL